MAWNPSPRVADCRDIARKWVMNQTVIIGINTETGVFEIASYGETKSLCADAKRLGDAVNKIILADEY